MPASLLSIGLATPDPVPQTTAADLSVALNCANPDHESFLRRVFDRTGIATRGSVLAHDLREFYPLPTSPDDRGPTTQTRMLRYAREAPPLAERASREALAKSDVQPREITHLITVSCTGFFSPGLDAALIDRLQLSTGTQRTHVGFMGCHAALNALTVANGIVATNPRAVVLLVCVELCTLHFGYGFTPDRIIANSLFADGAAATVVTAPRAGAPYTLVATASKLLPDSQPAMTWSIANHGYEMTLSPDVPKLISQHLPAWLNAWLPATETKLQDIANHAVHPGGPKVLTASAATLNLPDAALAPSREVLRRHGNISSATILFILDQIQTPGPTLSLAFGPGLTMEGALLTRN